MPAPACPVQISICLGLDKGFFNNADILSIFKRVCDNPVIVYVNAVGMGDIGGDLVNRFLDSTVIGRADFFDRNNIWNFICVGYVIIIEIFESQDQSLAGLLF